MTDFTPNHPAVEAGSREFWDVAGKFGITWAETSERNRKAIRHIVHLILTAAIPHLTEGNLRDTPDAGKDGDQ